MPQRCLVLYSSIILLTGLGAIDFVDYEYVKNFGWLHLHTVPATWADARLRCNMEGGYLASPTNVYLIKLMKSTMSKRGMANKSVFVDIHSTKPKGNFTSLDGQSLANVPLQWENQEPNNLGNDEDCLVMTSSGKMADVSCMSVHPYICVKSNVSTLKCDTRDKEYILDPRTDSCYKFHREFVPWRRAYMVCITEHAQLAVINSNIEALVLMELFEKHPNEAKTAHVGFLDWDQNGDFLTIFGETLLQAGYDVWAKGQPDDAPPGQYCGGMLRNGQLDDVGCIFDKLPYICETPLKPI